MAVGAALGQDQWGWEQRWGCDTPVGISRSLPAATRLRQGAPSHPAGGSWLLGASLFPLGAGNPTFPTQITQVLTANIYLAIGTCSFLFFSSFYFFFFNLLFLLIVSI